MEVKRVSIKSLKSASYNPSRRIQERRLASLCKSMEMVGLIYPIAITKSNQIIDGHRRLAAAKQLGWTEVPVLIVQSESHADALYAEINNTGYQLSGSEKLEVWLNNPNAVTARSQTEFSNAEESFGRPILKALVRAGTGTSILRRAREIAEYLDTPDDSRFLKKAARWILKHRNSRQVTSYIEMRQSGSVLLNAIRADKPLKPRFAVA